MSEGDAPARRSEAGRWLGVAAEDSRVARACLGIDPPALGIAAYPRGYERDEADHDRGRPTRCVADGQVMIVGEASKRAVMAGHLHLPRPGFRLDLPQKGVQSI
jgi:hypothetical protein